MNLAVPRITRIFTVSLMLSSWLATARGNEKPANPVPQPYLLQMIRDEAVQQDLGLDAAAIAEIEEAIAEVDPRWWMSRIMPAENQASEIRELTDLLRERLKTILDEDQKLRIGQLERQAAGTRMLRQPDVVEKLAITSPQSEKLQQRFDKTDEEITKIQKQLAESKIDSKQAGQQTAAIQQEERQSLLKLLTEDQRRKIGSLVGETFDFAAVKRTYPRGPEFVTEGATWLDGEGVTLADLRGKVVVVFFYAFECINCQRNFPHYLAWEEELGDDGLVVIGIQSPETSAERDLAKVAAAKHGDGFKFPVLFDQESNNWRAWGTTMWPTTYVIDKDGFIRRWWQGEMNWQGTKGEQDMRETIKGLLAEK